MSTPPKPQSSFDQSMAARWSVEGRLPTSEPGALGQHHYLIAGVTALGSISTEMGLSGHFRSSTNNGQAVIACDKREAFAQGSDSDEAIHAFLAARWIASRSLSSGGALRRHVGSQ